ncbi:MULTISPECIES: hypothetical protein [Paraburkholderia]|uniref:hypothetical protein n=1 Tax=Paraburkholderia TaxID=1822464 RepID=UPI002255907E|nr:MULTISPECIES: hypothetical protein [Paraburkholderia]MCX4161871.1 hypothetical protein [Paraburkholderia megapolitana]MDN7157368.1 hypothetical protein [Paraburkholderia sp. CHISQ3]MDQ6494413.1 hypothetical protein [Paraburkholderia megapolitana]
MADHLNGRERVSHTMPPIAQSNPGFVGFAATHLASRNSSIHVVGNTGATPLFVAPASLVQ